VAQERYASRLSGILAGQEYLGGILLLFEDSDTKKIDRKLCLLMCTPLGYT
jgi:hypothetical protein